MLLDKLINRWVVNEHNLMSVGLQCALLPPFCWYLLHFMSFLCCCWGKCGLWGFLFSVPSSLTSMLYSMSSWGFSLRTVISCITASFSRLTNSTLWSICKKAGTYWYAQINCTNQLSLVSCPWELLCWLSCLMLLVCFHHPPSHVLCSDLTWPNPTSPIPPLILRLPAVLW